MQRLAVEHGEAWAAKAAEWYPPKRPRSVRTTRTGAGPGLPRWPPGLTASGRPAPRRPDDWRKLPADEGLVLVSRIC
jgi:hypothetical protein